MRIILLIMIGVSTSLSADFSRNINGIVSDSKTGLFWQDTYTDNNNVIKGANWVDGIDYCEALVLGGNDDWRLPNIKELLSIVDYGKYIPSISSVFEKTKSEYWLSSTTDANETVSHLKVHFGYGYIGSGYKPYCCTYIRCVRGG